VLSEILGIVESLLRSGWVAVLGNDSAGLDYYNNLCRELEPGDCIKISFVLPDGTQYTYPFVRKSPKLKEVLKASDSDFERLMLIEVHVSGGKIREVVVVLSPDTSQVHEFAKSIYRGLLMQLERVKMEIVARNLPHM
jgi:hypothetical protein